MSSFGSYPHKARVKRRLDPITSSVKDRFERAEVHIEDLALEKILDAAECHPYYTQYLCHILYDVMENRKITPEDIPKAVEHLLERESTAYMNTWDLLTRRQRQALIVLSETAPGESPLRAEALSRFGISRPSVMIRALRSRIEKDLVDKEEGSYEIIDCGPRPLRRKDWDPFSGGLTLPIGPNSNIFSLSIPINYTEKQQK
jgi:hypothetical protein